MQKTAPSRAWPKESNTADRHVHDRLTYFLGACIVRIMLSRSDASILTILQGLSVNITLNDGNSFEGIFSASNVETTESSLITKMTKRLSEPEIDPRHDQRHSLEAIYVGPSPDYTMTFNVKDIADVSVPNLSIPEPARLSASKSQPLA